MDNSITSRFKNAWNAFMNKDAVNVNQSYSYGSYFRPDRTRLSRGNERSIVTSVLNRIALDVASIDIKHCRTDGNDKFVDVVDSSLNSCLNLEANLDQTSRAFIQDAVLSMFDDGCVALIPIDTSINPLKSNSYDILTMRVGKITQWYPDKVKVYVYNERKGRREELIISKSKVAIIENPLYAVMNEPSSTLQRLTRKLVLLDGIDEQTSSGKLDLIIQLPYVIKSDARREQANQRRTEIERQLTGSKYGIAYTDGTEKITQLNRPVENNLMKQIEYLTSMLYSQLGITQTILDGTADEKTMLNYYTRSIEPIVEAIALEMKRKFLTKTARSQGQSIMYFRNPFKLVPVKELAELADKLTRNEILSSNEVRGIIGYKPSDDPKADQLVNSNINQPIDEVIPNNSETLPDENNPDENQNGKNSNESEEDYMNRIMDSLTDEQYSVVEKIFDSLKGEK